MNSAGTMLNDYNTLYVSPATFGAIKRAAVLPPEEVFDWSECRSPSRAKRRYARGLLQRVKVAHNEVALLINEDTFTRAAANAAERIDTMFMKQLYGSWWP